MSFTPMVQQYLQIKNEYKDAILFFRLGDFYEMFFDDAQIASRELEITLTGREGGPAGRIPMCGVPFHAAENYIARLVEKGYKVAICEQVEDPALVKGIVRREVTRVVTPGTIIEGQLLEEKKNNFIAAMVEDKGIYGLASADIGTGLFIVTEFSGENALNMLLDEIFRLQPAELVLPPNIFFDNHLVEKVKGQVSLTLSNHQGDAFTYDLAYAALLDHSGANLLENSGLNHRHAATCAAGGLLSFLHDTQKRELSHLKKIDYYYPYRYMMLDPVTIRNLELFRALYDNSQRNTLLSVLDYTRTAMGGRLLKLWLRQPLLDLESIEMRQVAIEELAKSFFLRKGLEEKLAGIYDLERLVGKIAFGSANARDLLVLKVSLELLPGLKKLLEGSRSALLLKANNQIDLLSDLKSMLEESIKEDPPVSLKEGGLIKEGYNAEIDRLRSVKRTGKTWLTEFETRERERTGIKSLKVGFNKVFGYYIEISNSNLHLVPDNYSRRQTLANAERFLTPELKEYEDLILGAEDRLVQLEYQVFLEIREKVTETIPRLQSTAMGIAIIDVLFSLAEAAARNNYVRPDVEQSTRLFIQGGRHPVIEQILGPGRFVPNDLNLDEGNHFVLLTGPNMAGKSTFMRSLALIVLMAQVGSFVPATSAVIGIVDRILTRMGASDNLAGGQSTFMVEMKECQTITSMATRQSLVLMDEVGRGTSTYDGISIARALAEYIHNKIGARVLFSTHYHELTDLEKLPGVTNYTMAVREEGEEIIFLYKVVPGKADRSYGIYVAQLAGLPPEVLTHARDVLAKLESNKEASCRETDQKDDDETGQFQKEVTKGTVELERGKKSLSESVQLAFFTPLYEEHPVLRELKSIDVFSITPMQAINKLYQLQRRLRNR